MASHTIQVAVVGAGYMAREHIRAFNDIAGVRVSGIMSRTRARAEQLAQEFGIAHVADTMADLAQQSQAQVVVVAVPELAARPVLEAAAEFPWTILAEKPVGYCMADAEAITRILQEKGRTLYVALNRRFYSATQAALHDLTTQPGQRFIEVFDQQAPRAALEAGQPEEVVRHWMYANSVHTVDYLKIFGRGEVMKITHIMPWTPEQPGHVVAALHFSSGDTGLYHAIWDGPGPWACFVSTPQKRWELRPLEQAHYQNAGERRLTPFAVDAWDNAFKAGLRKQAQEVIQALEGKPTAAVSLHEANTTMRLVHDIYQM